MVLFDLTDDFRQLVSSKGIEIASLFETKKTKIGIFSQVWINPQIVEERSATLGVIRERKTAINANHSNLCKFRNSTDSPLINLGELDSSKEYPVLILGQYTYWALSYIDNRAGYFVDDIPTIQVESDELSQTLRLTL
ncbi:uncharacterized protein C8R40DRAFT_1075065 [Lentinula edodes]|uniref:uncharacterized protein n=1 Tax=Lentinula edodes TaxID=5353 RepID=UPI001E8E4E6A|nr:uncharacterized protein C8R40DRAFT_1075065 [Lentinula edodes]KAH7868130.1 hypothetical protein C8R40DRAFT_1075065 [Lentinula edodes]